jgi:dienelactone hydrolase
MVPPPETVVERWAKLEPSMRVWGPSDETRRPAVILFHGCGGIRPHIQRYGEAAAAQGFRAFEIDSFKPRGWSNEFAQAFVCTAALLRGHERAGDVLAAINGISKRPDVDPNRIVLAGWSHGGWGIMELMSAERTPGDMGLADPESVSLAGIKANFLVYPYVGFLAPARARPWRVKPRTLAIIANFDHLATPKTAERVYQTLREDGVEVESWNARGTHCFDEPSPVLPMRHDEALTVEAIDRFLGLLKGV